MICYDLLSQERVFMQENTLSAVCSNILSAVMMTSSLCNKSLINASLL